MLFFCVCQPCCILLVSKLVLFWHAHLCWASVALYMLLLVLACATLVPAALRMLLPVFCLLFEHDAVMYSSCKSLALLT